MRLDAHCRRKGCRCTHGEPCDRGWIESPYVNPTTGVAYERVAPCPVCRWEAATRLAETLPRESRDVR